MVLVNPQIPNNTGAIGRLCVNCGATLHLVKPLGFDISEKAVRRAGLDYWDKLDLKIWENIEELMASQNQDATNYFATTKTDKPYFEQNFKENDYLFFGSETSGLPEELLKSNSETCMTIPMTKDGRSLNLAISTGIILYDAIRQNFTTYQTMM